MTKNIKDNNSDVQQLTVNAYNTQVKATIVLCLSVEQYPDI